MSYTTLSGAYSGICPGKGGLNFFLFSSAPVGAWKPAEIHRFQWSRGVLAPIAPPLNTPLNTLTSDLIHEVALLLEFGRRKYFLIRMLYMYNFFTGTDTVHRTEELEEDWRADIKEFQASYRETSQTIHKTISPYLLISRKRTFIKFKLANSMIHTCII